MKRPCDRAIEQTLESILHSTMPNGDAQQAARARGFVQGYWKTIIARAGRLIWEGAKSTELRAYDTGHEVGAWMRSLVDEARRR